MIFEGLRADALLVMKTEVEGIQGIGPQIIT
jgi:hypothetical protein